MIDKVQMSCIINIPAELLTTGHGWRWCVKAYVHNYRDLRLFYVPQTRRLTIRGRLISVSSLPDHVSNLDSLDAGVSEIQVRQQHQFIDGQRQIIYSLENVAQDLDGFILDLNQYLTALVGQPIDVSLFHVTYIEVCFNTYTDYVDDYIRLFNLVFQKRGLTRYKNFVLENAKPLYSSFYVRGRAQFDRKVKLGYTINFYNKRDWLENQLAKDRAKDQARLQRRNARWNRLLDQGKFSSLDELIANNQPSRQQDRSPSYTLVDVQKASRDLRLEVQCGYRSLGSMFGRERPFRDFLDLVLCQDIIVGRYEAMIGPARCSFYSYQVVKEIVNNAGLSNIVRRNLLDYLLKLSKGLDVKQNGNANYHQKLADLGIHWCLIPKNYGIDYLESPMALLDRTVMGIIERRADYQARKVAADFEVDAHNNMEVAEDEIVTITTQFSAD